MHQIPLFRSNKRPDTSFHGNSEFLMTVEHENKG